MFYEEFEKKVLSLKPKGSKDIQGRCEKDDYHTFQIAWQADFYSVSRDIWLALMRLSDGLYVLQENHDDGKITYIIDGGKYLKPCLKAIKDKLGLTKTIV